MLSSAPLNGASTSETTSSSSSSDDDEDCGDDALGFGAGAATVAAAPTRHSIRRKQLPSKLRAPPSAD